MAVSRVCLGRATCRWAFVLGSFASLFAGCATPIAYQVYDPLPVEAGSVRIVVREVHRGERGGVVTLALTNLSGDLLELVSGAQVILRPDGGTMIPALNLSQFQHLVDLHGPIAMGFDHWSPAAMPVALDPLGARVNLKTGEEALVHVAFQLPAQVDRLEMDVAPACRWRTSEGAVAQLSEAILLAVQLPEVPKSKLPTKDDWQRNVHFGVVISSDGF